MNAMYKQVVFPKKDYITHEKMVSLAQECKLSIKSVNGSYAVFHAKEPVRDEWFETLIEANDALMFEATRINRISNQFDSLISSFDEDK